MVGYVDKRGIWIDNLGFEKDEYVVKVYEEKDIDKCILDIKLDLNCVVWLDDEHRNLLDSVLNKRFKKLKGGK